MRRKPEIIRKVTGDKVITAIQDDAAALMDRIEWPELADLSEVEPLEIDAETRAVFDELTERMKTDPFFNPEKQVAELQAENKALKQEIAQIKARK